MLLKTPAKLRVKSEHVEWVLSEVSYVHMIVML